MDQDPIYEKTIELPLGYVFTARARPSTMRRTVLMLLPWAVYAMLPAGRRSRAVLALARRFAPLVRQSVRR